MWRIVFYALIATRPTTYRTAVERELDNIKQTPTTSHLKKRNAFTSHTYKGGHERTTILMSPVSTSKNTSPCDHNQYSVFTHMFQTVILENTVRKFVERT